MLSRHEHTRKDESGADEPGLLGTQQLRPAHILGGSTFLAIAGIAFMAWSGVHDLPSSALTSTTGSAGGARIVFIDPQDVPGMMTRLPSDIKMRNDNVVSLLHVPENRKAYVKSELDKGRMRVGSISVWDSVAEDGDEIRLSAAGIDQVVRIAHTPRTYLVPHFPGGSMRISGTRDGGEGITLGIKTMLGPVHLPRLAVGEVMEIPLQ